MQNKSSLLVGFGEVKEVIKEKIKMSFLNTHHSSSRSVSMRDIVVGVPSAPLYPAFAACRVGVTNGAGGFTLIELLVVVLIIGILAAIALPQYQKAVWKSRNTQLKAVIKTLRQAQDAYFLANGQYAGNFNELDVDLPLSAPDMGTRDMEDICMLAIKGSDSVRRAEHFQVVLNSTSLKRNMLAVAVWTDGPYKCMGFKMTPEGKMFCLQAGWVTTAQNNFCEKIERGTNKTGIDSWYSWELP